MKKACPVDMFPWTAHVETVCLLSKLHEAKHHVNVTLDMDEMDLAAAEALRSRVLCPARTEAERDRRLMRR